MKQIIECVPNFSDGRNPEVYNAIAKAIRSVPGTHVLDISADPDHNRSVITFVGSPASVEEGAFRAIAEAAKHINLDKHEGEHPRIGATDVCPIIPVKDVTVDECVALANRLGKRVGYELGITVYLYGEAATRPERKKLSTIRHGEYERWRENVDSSAHHKPDYGPAEANSWGATVIGVRQFLIAYNLFLNTDDVTIAKKIAKSVRFSSGGLRFVQALGFIVDGQAQVSMNLTDFSKTPIHLVQETVKSEAARYGVSVTKSELIGLIPEQALLASAKWYLQLDGIVDDKVLELRLAEETKNNILPQPYLAATAEGTPTPGGGSAAALAGALAGALIQMVANLTTGRKNYLDVEVETQEVLKRSAELRARLTNAITRDADAFEQLLAAWNGDDSSPEDKALEIENATYRAAAVPFEVGRLCLEVAQIAKRITSFGNVNAVTDAAAAAILAQAAVKIAALNVKTNVTGLKDRQQAQLWLEEIDQLEMTVQRLVDDSIATATKRGGF
jgi:glutamate formiminotransferase/formiminotetrahydrofolate cyclodeaminase